MGTGLPNRRSLTASGLGNVAGLGTPCNRAPCQHNATAQANRAAPPASHGPATLVISLFALFSGVALLLIGVLLPDLHPVPVAALDSSASRAAAERFYTAYDAALDTGDSHLLIAAVAPGFVDHRPEPGEALDRGEFIAEVAALRRVRPGIRVEARALLVDGDYVQVYVRHAPDDSIVATPSADRSPGDRIELLRIAGGVVAERWSLTGVAGNWSAALMTPTPVPPWSSSRFATATAEGLVCLASVCH
jgi:hypothetical protein